VLERWPNAVVVLAPRHPERFEEVARLLVSSGLRFWRRSQWEGEPVAGGVFLLDTIGELAATYALAQVAFVGGSLVPRGGHNVLEAAAAGAAIVVGPYTENFRDIVALFSEAGALRVLNSDNVKGVMLELLAHEDARAQMSARAAGVLRAHAGATERTLAAIESLMHTRASEAVR
jgi:3-deoxy-D-manno-octulosonic-acid transferase